MQSYGELSKKLIFFSNCEIQKFICRLKYNHVEKYCNVKKEAMQRK